MAAGWTQAARQATPFKPAFFTAHEYATVAVLVDLIIPRDERSGSATEAGVPEFMDFMMIDQPRRQVAMRGGLALIDRLSEERAGKRFAACSDAERRGVLDEIAYTSNPDPSLSHAIAFFSSFRDLTATGFFTSWGFWNLIFYPAVGQWLSFLGGAVLVTMNAIWFGQLLYYSRKERARIILSVADIPPEHLKAA